MFIGSATENNENQQPRNIEEFMNKMEPFTKDLAPELKEQIFSTANTFFGGVKGEGQSTE
jgi:hypothetical protein